MRELYILVWDDVQSLYDIHMFRAVWNLKWCNAGYSHEHVFKSFPLIFKFEPKWPVFI